MGFKLLRVWLFVLMAIVTAKVQKDSAENQLVLFKEKTKGPIAVMTTGAGAPIDYSQTSTLNKKLIYNDFFMESVTHLVREKIPERMVHAKGTGAFRYFEVTHDITDICKASLFGAVGKRTPVAVRFSTASAEKGSMDTPRETRGFAVKFYTEEGNFDIVGLSIPVFFIKDPIFVSAFTRIIKRNPATALKDPNMVWDFITLHPESLHGFFHIFGDHGIPDGYRYLPGFSVHTYQLVSKCGENYFVRFHFIPDAGVKTITSDEAEKIAGKDPDSSTRDLYNAISRGDYPSWTVGVQVLSTNDVKRAGFDVFDVTKLLPLDKYPVRPIGRLVLNENPVNNFAQIEQLAYCPGNLVPGILGSPDKLFESRLLAYRDAHNYRLGANFFNIPVNCPLFGRAFTYNRDGIPPLKDNMRDIPNYYPNTFNGPVPYKELDGIELVEIYEQPPNNLCQAQDLYLKGMSSAERRRMIENIVTSLREVTSPCIQERAVKLLSLVSTKLGETVWEGLNINGTMYA